MRCAQALDRRLVETKVEIASMLADQFFPAVAQTLAGLAIDVENDRMIVKQKESVECVVHEGAKARLARAQLTLRLPQLRDVLQNAKLAHRLSRSSHVTSPWLWTIRSVPSGRTTLYSMS